MTTPDQDVDTLLALAAPPWDWKTRHLGKLARRFHLKTERVSAESTFFLNDEGPVAAARSEGGQVLSLGYRWSDAGPALFEQVTRLVIGRLGPTFGVVRSRLAHRRVWRPPSGVSVEVAYGDGAVSLHVIDQPNLPPEWRQTEPPTPDAMAEGVAQVAAAVVGSGRTLLDEARNIVPLERAVDAEPTQTRPGSLFLDFERAEPPFDLQAQLRGHTPDGKPSYVLLVTYPFLAADLPGQDMRRYLDLVCGALWRRWGAADTDEGLCRVWNREGWSVEAKLSDGDVSVVLRPDGVEVDADGTAQALANGMANLALGEKSPRLAIEVILAGTLFERALQDFRWDTETVNDLSRRLDAIIDPSEPDPTDGAVVIDRSGERYYWYLYADLERPGRFRRLSHLIDPDEPGGDDWEEAARWCLRRWGETCHETENQLSWWIGSGLLALIRDDEDGTLRFTAVPRPDGG